MRKLFSLLVLVLAFASIAPVFAASQPVDSASLNGIPPFVDTKAFPVFSGRVPPDWAASLNLDQEWLEKSAWAAVYQGKDKPWSIELLQSGTLVWMDHAKRQVRYINQCGNRAEVFPIIRHKEVPPVEDNDGGFVVWFHSLPNWLQHFLRVVFYGTVLALGLALVFLAIGLVVEAIGFLIRSLRPPVPPPPPPITRSFTVNAPHTVRRRWNGDGSSTILVDPPTATPPLPAVMMMDVPAGTTVTMETHHGGSTTVTVV